MQRLAGLRVLQSGPGHASSVVIEAEEAWCSGSGCRV